MILKLKNKAILCVETKKVEEPAQEVCDECKIVFDYEESEESEDKDDDPDAMGL